MGENLPDLMTCHEVARFFRLSPKNGWQTILSYARRGELKGIKLGQYWRFPKESVIRFVQTGGSR